MIYTLFEMQRAALAPLRIAAEGHLSALRNPLNPVAWTPGGRVAAAALDLFEHTTRPYGKPDFNLPFGHATSFAGGPLAALRSRQPELTRYETAVPGLYLTGAATFPGAGVWGASGRNCAQKIIKRL